MYKILRIALILSAVILSSSVLKGQISTGEVTGEQNVVESAVPFLTIAPDSRAGAMGDVGVATSPDINSMHWNPAKYAMIDDEAGVSLSYTPWLRNLIPDINLAYLSGFYRIDDQQVISSSLLYFSLGEIIFTNFAGDYQGQHTPNEFAIDAGYSRLFSEKMSGGIAFRFIRSDLTGGVILDGGAESKAGISFAADISTYYETDITLDDKPGELAFGLNISNMGTKVSYTEDNQDDAFIPINLRLGSRLTMNLDDYNSVSFSADLNKLLVPTTPQKYDKGDVLPNGDTVQVYGVIKNGKDPDVAPPVGMIQSFYDAPGGLKEELREIMISIGAEYWYREQFAIRAGYFHEHATKGNRKYFTTGIGLKLNVFSIDFAYLVPTSGRSNPLANTMRFTLLFEFDKYSKK